MHINLERLDFNIPNKPAANLSLSHLMYSSEGLRISNDAKTNFSINRFNILRDFRDILEEDLVAGGSLQVVKAKILLIDKMVLHNDAFSRELSHATVIDAYVEWVASQFKDIHNGQIKQDTFVLILVGHTQILNYVHWIPSFLLDHWSCDDPNSKLSYLQMHSLCAGF